MALARKINKAKFEGLSDELKKEYKSTGEDEFTLQTEGDEDTSALKRAKDREKQRADEAEKALGEKEAEIEKLIAGDKDKYKDIKTLEKSWQKKLDDQVAEGTARETKYKTHIQKTLVDNVASDLAHKISTAPALLLPHIKGRITVDWEGDEPKTRILDKDGKPSALTVEELGKEFSTNKDFSAIIRVSQASGGAPGRQQQKGGNGVSGQQQPNAPDLSTMNPKALSEHLKEIKAQENNA